MERDDICWFEVATVAFQWIDLLAKINAWYEQYPVRTEGLSPLSG